MADLSFHPFHRGATRTGILAMPDGPFLFGRIRRRSFAERLEGHMLAGMCDEPVSPGFLRRRISILLLVVAVGGDGLRAGDGPAIFNAQCASCHGPDGRAQTPAGRRSGAHDLAESRIPDAEIARRIAEGVKNASGRLKMPAFKDQLSDDEIRDLVLAVKAFREVHP
jgi:cytochrome c553